MQRGLMNLYTLSLILTCHHHQNLPRISKNFEQRKDATNKIQPIKQNIEDNNYNSSTKYQIVQHGKSNQISKTNN